MATKYKAFTCNIVDFSFIFSFMYFQTMAVLNPLKQADHTIMQDTDLAGPFVFCLAFGGSLMLVSVTAPKHGRPWSV